MTKRHYQGFTLVELLVVIAIIGVLVALLLPAVQSARESARRSQCMNNVKQLGIAFQNYHDTQGSLPVGAYSCCWGTWQVSVLPFIEQRNLFALYHAPPFKTIAFPDTHRYDETLNKAVALTSIPTLTCPSDEPALEIRGFTKHNYVVNFGNTVHYRQPDPFRNVTFQGAPFYGTENTRNAPVTRFKEITDGLSNTLMASETVQGRGTDLRGFTWWGWAAGFETFMPPNSSEPDAMQVTSYCDLKEPANPPCVPASNPGNPMKIMARSRHVGGVNVVMCDSSCRFVQDEVDEHIWRAQGTKLGDEVF